MKRKVFALGASSVTVVALAIAAVMAGLSGDGTQALSTMTDEVAVTVEPGCTFIAQPDNETERAVTLGQGGVVKDIEGVKFNVTCSGRDFEGSWTVTARGNDEAKMSDGAGHEIMSSDGNLTGEVSNWAMKMTVTGAAIVNEGYLDYTQVPTEEVQVAANKGEKATGDATIQARYGVSAQADQVAGTYRGEVVYTLTNVAE